MMVKVLHVNEGYKTRLTAKKRLDVLEGPVIFTIKIKI